MKNKLAASLAIILALTGTGINTYVINKSNSNSIATMVLNKIEFQTVKLEEIPPNLVEKIQNNKTHKGYIYFTDDRTGDIYVAILYGEKPTAGYSVLVNLIEQNDGKTNVFVTEKNPLPNDTVAQVITYPYTVIRTRGITPNISVLNGLNEKYQNLIGVSTIEGTIKSYGEDPNRIYVTIEDSTGNLRYYFTNKVGKWLGQSKNFKVGDKVTVNYTLGSPIKYNNNSYLPFTDMTK